MIKFMLTVLALFIDMTLIRAAFHLNEAYGESAYVSFKSEKGHGSGVGNPLNKFEVGTFVIKHRLPRK